MKRYRINDFLFGVASLDFYQKKNQEFYYHISNYDKSIIHMYYAIDKRYVSCYFSTFLMGFINSNFKLEPSMIKAKQGFICFENEDFTGITVYNNIVRLKDFLIKKGNKKLLDEIFNLSTSLKELKEQEGSIYSELLKEISGK